MIDYAALNSWAVERKPVVAPIQWSLSFKRVSAPAFVRSKPAPAGPVLCGVATLLGAGVAVAVALALFSFFGPWALLLFCPAVVVVRPEKGWSR
jgi:hypothetical protein